MVKSDPAPQMAAGITIALTSGTNMDIHHPTIKEVQLIQWQPQSRETSLPGEKRAQGSFIYWKASLIQK